MRRLTFPLIHERTELSSLRKPDHCMDMIRHNDKSQTQSIPLGKFRAEMPNDNPFRSIGVQKSTAAIAGECDEVDMFLVIVNPPFHHRSVTFVRIRRRQLRDDCPMPVVARPFMVGCRRHKRPRHRFSTIHCTSILFCTRMMRLFVAPRPGHKSRWAIPPPTFLPQGLSIDREATLTIALLDRPLAQ